MTYTLSYGRYRFNFFTERVKVIPVSLLFIMAIASAMLMYVYGGIIANRVFHNDFIVELIASLRTPILGVLFFLIILISYRMLPRIKVPTRGPDARCCSSNNRYLARYMDVFSVY